MEQIWLLFITTSGHTRPAFSFSLANTFTQREREKEQTNTQQQKQKRSIEPFHPRPPRQTVLPSF